jgi:hypothetical protein
MTFSYYGQTNPQFIITRGLTSLNYKNSQDSLTPTSLTSILTPLNKILIDIFFLNPLLK